jgi:hypothetical protein
MANRNFYSTQYTYEVEPVKIYAKILVGAAGAVSGTKLGLGVAGVVKEATAGQYSITLQNKFAQLLGVNITVIAPIPTVALATQILETPSAIQADIKADKTFKIQLLDVAGAAVNVASGDEILVEITMRQSKIGRGD